MGEKMYTELECLDKEKKARDEGYRLGKIKASRDIKTVIGDYSKESAEKAFKRCKEIIQENGGQ